MIFDRVINEQEVSLIYNNSYGKDYINLDTIARDEINIFALHDISDGWYKYNIECIASNDNSAFSYEGNRTFAQDINVPVISILSPKDTVNSRTLNISIDYQDTSSASYCYYNISVGEILLQTNTALNILNFTETTNSGIDGTFILKVWCNDTFGRGSGTSGTFTVDTTTSPTPPSTGGGGGTTIVVGEETTRWEMQTGEGGTSYIINLLSDTERTKSLRFRNVGDSSRTITLDCINIEGTLCDYVKFDEKVFTLPLVKDTWSIKYFTIYLPPELTASKYVFNIRATDDLNNFGIISVTANTDLNLIVEIGTKLTSWKRITEKFSIPYIVIFLFSWIITWLFINFVIFRKVKGGLALSAVLALLVALLVILLI
jgi:hypothetical protein